MATALLGELKRRGVFGALTAYGVVAAGGLQVCDIVFKTLDLPAWSMRVTVWGAALGFVVTAVVSWFWDLTRRGFVRTEAPTDRALSPRTPAQATGTPPRLDVGTPQPLASGAALQTLASLKAGALLANGRYRIEEELGSGGMGKVFAASDTRLGRRVAIKVVTAAHDPARVRRFEQEARAAGGLEHPNVLGVYDLGEQDGVPFLVTELLAGHTLRKRISAGPLPPAEARQICLQLARGLSAAHQRGVVHRDLKPENVFVTTDGRVKILDFGLAKLITPGEESVRPGEQGLTVTGAIFGTPGYLSPEQARGEPAGAPSDVFSAGAVLYELLTGRRAFPGPTLVEAAHAALTQPPPELPASVPPALASIALRCLQKDPAQRFQTGADLAAALEADLPVAHGDPAAPPTLPAKAGPAQLQASPGMLRRSTGLGLGAAGLALGAAIASAALVRKDAAKKQPVARTSSRQTAQAAQAAQAPQAPTAPAEVEIPVPPAPPPAAFPFDSSAIPKVDLGKLSKLDADVVNRQLRRVRGGRIGVLTGGWAVWRAGQTEKAEGLLRSAQARDPSDPYSHLLLAAIQRTTGRASEAAANLKELDAELEDDEWPTPIVRAWEGKIDDDDKVLAQAKDDEDEQGRPSRLCEAHFWLGLYHLTASPPDKEKARGHFERAVELNTSDLEAGFARQELASLGK